VRTLHEPILVATMGKSGTQAAPIVIRWIAREHSRKPAEFYDLLVKRTPAAVRRADLFSRETGWDSRVGAMRRKFDMPTSHHFARRQRERIAPGQPFGPTSRTYRIE
jgi:N6-adenosine-specific RNA methylase IME4